MICEKNRCTGCGLCTAICPQKCITLQKNEYGSFKYHIDQEKCIHCKKCERMCPQNSPPLSSNIKCYAGWAIDPKERQTSSSGGVAAALYRYILSMGGAVVGACYENGEFSLKLTQNEEDIEKFKGSKYVNCTSLHIYEQVKQTINQDVPVLFVGTPCQVAAIKAYIGSSELLITVDLVCHGTPPQYVFEEHFKAKDKGIVSVNFRDGGIYKLNIEKENGEQFVIDSGTDEYYLSFINGITFSDCCYECQYARKERCSDITIGDFRGLEKSVYEGIERPSVIISNTLQGDRLLSAATNIKLIERDISEALSKNEQLSNPFVRSDDRKKYEKLYPVYGFDKTIHKLSLEKIRKRNKLLTKLSEIKNKVVKQ